MKNEENYVTNITVHHERDITMTVEGIKELKRNIIGKMEYYNVEEETNESGTYELENLILESDNVVYSRTVVSDNKTLCASHILCSREEFSTMHIKDILSLIGQVCYYNTVEVTES